MTTKKQLIDQIKEIQDATKKHDNKVALCEGTPDYAGNASYTLGWIRAIAFRYEDK